jgi:hypothetical protein
MKSLVLALCLFSMAGYGLMAQSLSCRDHEIRSSQFCEVRETTISSTASLTVDGKQNGGVSVIGANRADILVRAKVEAHSDTMDPRAVGAQVLVHTAGGTVSADGPSGQQWSVSYEIFVPMNTDLKLTTHNGGVAVQGVRSSVEFHAVNGGVAIKDVGGSVLGETENGGISLKISDPQWNGRGIDISTTNGGISLKVPERFSGLLDLATVNGGMDVRLPGTQLSRNQKRLSMTVGAGGPPVRVHTTNGGVSVAVAL